MKDVLARLLLDEYLNVQDPAAFRAALLEALQSVAADKPAPKG